MFKYLSANYWRFVKCQSEVYYINRVALSHLIRSASGYFRFRQIRHFQTFYYPNYIYISAGLCAIALRPCYKEGQGLGSRFLSQSFGQFQKYPNNFKSKSTQMASAQMTRTAQKPSHQLLLLLILSGMGLRLSTLFDHEITLMYDSCNSIITIACLLYRGPKILLLGVGRRGSMFNLPSPVFR